MALYTFCFLPGSLLLAVLSVPITQVEWSNCVRPCEPLRRPGDTSMHLKYFIYYLFKYRFIDNV